MKANYIISALLLGQCWFDDTKVAAIGEKGVGGGGELECTEQKSLYRGAL